MNALDKYFILFLLGSSFNGIYAVAGKIPAIVTTFSTLFVQAWQVSAISEGKSKDKDTFFSEVFNALLFFLALIVSMIFIILRLVLTYCISSNYENVWSYVPFLMFGSIFTCISGFIGANYLASKRTSGAFYSSFIGLLVNLIFNYLLIKIFGLNGAAMATALSLFSVCVIRIIHSHKFVRLSINIWKTITYVIVLIFESLFLYKSTLIASVVSAVVGTIVIMLINRHYFRLIIKAISGKFNKEI